MHLAKAQLIEEQREIYINEHALGLRGFFQADFDQDGTTEFLSDANELRNFLIGTVEDHQIITQKMGSFLDESNYAIDDMRYEDADGDGTKEFYAYYSQYGMFRYDLSTLLPIDTLVSFENYYDYKCSC